MTKKEYLSRLERCLECIENSEREAAIQFYAEYFDDAGEENTEKVISELGSPEKLAREIITQSADQGNSEQPAPDSITNGESFTSIDTNTVNARITIILGSEYKLDINYPEGTKKPEVSISNGVLRIEEKSRISFGKLFSPRTWRQATIDITVPDIEFNKFNIETVNGTVIIPGVKLNSLHCETVNGTHSISGVQARKIHCENVNGAISVQDCRVSEECHCETVNGELKMTGELMGKLHLESVNGAITFKTSMPLGAFNANFETVSGSVYINGEKQRKQTSIRSNVAEYRLFAETVNGSIHAEFEA